MISIDRIKKALLNPFAAKMFFVVFILLNDVAITFPIVNSYLKIGLLWSAIVLIYDFFTNRYFLKTRYAFLLVLFTISITITIFLNRNTSFRANINELIFSIVFFFILFPSASKAYGTNSKKRDLQELSIVNYTIISMTLILALVSIVMFYLQYSSSVVYNNTRYLYGMVANRLAGVYRNANYPNHIIGIFAAITQFLIERKKAQTQNYRYKLPKTILFIVSIVLNFSHFALTASRGSKYSLAAAAFVFGALCIYRKMRQMHKKIVLQIVSGLMIGVVFASASFGLYAASRATSKKTLKMYIEYQKDHPQKLGPLGKDKPDEFDDDISIDRPDLPAELSILTGRDLIWRTAIEKFKEKPILGYGPYSLENTIYVDELRSYLSTFHSFYFNTLVAAGGVGFILIMTFLALTMYRILKYLIISTDDKNYMIVLSIFAFLIFVFVLSIPEMTILFVLKYIAVAFWVYLGYGSRLASDPMDTPSKIDKPLRSLDTFMHHTVDRFRKGAKNEKN